MSYLGNYNKVLWSMVDAFDQKYYNIPVDEIDFSSEVVEDPYSTMVTSEQLWNDGESFVELDEFFAFSLVGPQGSGKTNIAKQISTFAQKKGYRIVYAMPDDYMPDVNAWIKLVTADSSSRTLFVLDDLSYFSDAQAKKQASLVKNMVARLRHIFKTRIFVIFITHRVHATPPMLRNSASWVFSKMQSADRDDCLEIIGRDKEQRDRLEQIYSFMSRISLEYAKPERIVKFTYKDKVYSFKWGDKYDAGDGRLMTIYHGGKLKIFLSKHIDTSINFEDFRYIPTPQVIENETRVSRKRKV